MRRHHTSRRLLGFALVAVIATLSFRPFTSVQAATERQRLGFPSMIPTEPTVQIGGVNLGNLPDYLFFFADAHTDANWQGATKGFVGDVAVDGVEASERTSGGVPYAGTIFTNDTTLSAWQGIVNQNAGQAFGSTGNIALISQLEGDLNNAFLQINALPATLGYASVSSTSLDGIDTTNGVAQTLVINVTSGFGISSQIDITGDANDAFILRWDTDANFSNGYDGQVKFQSGGAIVPHGGLKPTNFIHVAGDINASGGGSTPSAPYPQGPRLNDGQSALCTGCADFSGGGFFTGYWLTTGSPTNPADATHSVPYGDSSSLSNGIFVGGWYSINTKFSMTSGTSGVYVSPPAAPAIAVKKYVSVDNQATWDDAESAPGPTAIESSSVYFRFEVTNTGDVTLTNVTLSDSDFSPLTGCTVPATLNAGQSYSCVYGPVTAVVGQHENTATVQGSYGGATYSDTDKAHYYGTPVGAIGDFVWYDSDQDGIEDVGEPGIPNVTIQLRRDSNGNNILDPGDEYFADTVTDADGGYFFTDLPSGTYFVDVTDTNNVLAGLTHIVANQSKPDPTAAIAL
ncbi:MAG: SdrD B-like domain-containing protein, partial [Anaerolineae bacterium]